MNAIDGRDLDQPGDDQAVTYIRERLNGIQGADRGKDGDADNASRTCWTQHQPQRNKISSKV